MIVIAGLVHVQGGHEAEIAALVGAVVGTTRGEAGCISYDMYPTGTNDVFVFEQWASAEALTAHLAAPHTQKFLADVAPFLAAPPDLTRYTVTETAPLF